MQLLRMLFTFNIVVKRISKATIVFVVIFVFGCLEKVALQAIWKYYKK